MGAPELSLTLLFCPAVVFYSVIHCCVGRNDAQELIDTCAYSLYQVACTQAQAEHMRWAVVSYMTDVLQNRLTRTDNWPLDLLASG